MVRPRHIGETRPDRPRRPSHPHACTVAAVIALAPVKQAPPRSDAPRPCTWLDRPGGWL